MKKFFLTLLLAALASPAAATDFALFGAYQDTEDADEALGAGGKLRFGWLELRGTYFSDVTADIDPESRDFEVKMVPLEAGVAFRLGEAERFHPYLGGGAGYYLLDTTRGDIDDEVGYYAVAGTDIDFSDSLGLNVEAIYRSMEGTIRGDLDDDPEFIEEGELELGGLGLNAGLVWHF
jgi:opacity protein-like surface antigen